mmetsp:Transcript_58822/g.97192  ORF Transcript_58822/g.97192 Transcript_58822/m.97192 type:complete len:695 (-) Transcript_58822:417-2501(-)
MKYITLIVLLITFGQAIPNQDIPSGLAVQVEEQGRGLEAQNNKAIYLETKVENGRGIKVSLSPRENGRQMLFGTLPHINDTEVECPSRAKVMKTPYESRWTKWDEKTCTSGCTFNPCGPKVPCCVRPTNTIHGGATLIMHPREACVDSSVMNLCTRVTGGICLSHPREFEWLVEIRDSNLPWGWLTHRCGASLIAPNWVMTAGHCITNNLQYVTIGLHALNDYRHSCATMFKISRQQVIVHPDYKSRHGPHGVPINDIALMKLDRPVFYEPVALRSMKDVEADRTDATVMGWGKTEKKSTSKYPLKATLQIVNPCTRTDDEIGPEKLCATAEIQDSCTGDSGGPLVVQDGTTHVQVGIVSYGAMNCGASTEHTVYTRVSNYMSWICTNTGIPAICGLSPMNCATIRGMTDLSRLSPPERCEDSMSVVGEPQRMHSKGACEASYITTSASLLPELHGNIFIARVCKHSQETGRCEIGSSYRCMIDPSKGLPDGVVESGLFEAYLPTNGLPDKTRKGLPDGFINESAPLLMSTPPPPSPGPPPPSPKPPPSIPEAPSGPFGSCWFLVKSCPKRADISPNTWQRDNWGEKNMGANKDSNVCKKTRRDGYASFCGVNKNLIFMTFNGPPPAPQTPSGSCYYYIDLCPKNPAVARKWSRDTYGEDRGAGRDKIKCEDRQMDYVGWCGGESSVHMSFNPP